MKVQLIDKDYVRALIRPRPKDSHKGDYGHVFVLGGSPGLTGAAAMASESALRAGAGMVTLGVARSLNPIMEVKLTEVMTKPLPDTQEGFLKEEALEEVLTFLERVDAVALGPGLSTHPQTQRLVHDLLPGITLPLLIDADGLNILALKKELLENLPPNTVLTPHPGEMARLTNLSISHIKEQKENICSHYARRWRVVLVLKGAPTLVASPAGEVMENTTGNPGMATAGSGDVLTGIVVGLMAQKLSPFEAATFGVFLHGLSGDLAKEHLTEEAMIAGDLIRYLPMAWKKLAHKGGN